MVWGELLLPRWGWLGRQARTSQKRPRDERRAGQRVLTAMPVFIYGRLGHEPFSENTETMNVSANGGLVLLSTGVARLQKLLVTNLQTNEDLACRVARLGKNSEGQLLVGLEFLHASPRFWCIDFNP